MNALSNTFRLSALLLFCALGVQAQAPASDVKQFSKEGLEFSYPSGWVLEDTSNADAQQLNLTRADSEAQFRIFVFRPNVNSSAKLAEARKVLVDGYIAATVKQFEQMGVSPLKSPVSLDVGGVKSEGVRISATLGGEPGAAEVHWGVLGERLVVLTVFGPDNAAKKAAPVWETLRSSIVVQDPKPKATPTPK